MLGSERRGCSAVVRLPLCSVASILVFPRRSIVVVLSSPRRTRSVSFSTQSSQHCQLVSDRILRNATPRARKQESDNRNISQATSSSLERPLLSRAQANTHLIVAPAQFGMATAVLFAEKGAESESQGFQPKQRGRTGRDETNLRTRP
jgi:hypothetical protein